MNRSTRWRTQKHGLYSEDLSRPLPGTIVALAESTGLHPKVTKHNSLQTLYNQVCPVLIGPPLRGWDTKACAHSPCAYSSLNAVVLSSRTSDHRPRALQSERQRVPKEVWRRWAPTLHPDLEGGLCVQCIHTGGHWRPHLCAGSKPPSSSQKKSHLHG